PRYFVESAHEDILRTLLREQTIRDGVVLQPEGARADDHGIFVRLAEATDALRLPGVPPAAVVVEAAPTTTAAAACEDHADNDSLDVLSDLDAEAEAELAALTDAQQDMLDAMALAQQGEWCAVHKCMLVLRCAGDDNVDEDDVYAFEI